MASASMHRRRGIALAAGFSAAALVLAGCAAGGGDEDSSGGGTLTIGTTDKVTTLDPAGSYDNGSFAVMNQVFPFLMNSPYGTSEVEPDIAESAEYTAPNEYTVTLKEGLKFANGNDLTASDVKFSFDRQVAIADENGPSALLYNLDSVEVVDDTTVVFKLKSDNDQIFPQILSSPAGPIVDEDVFAADALTPDDEIVDGNAFAGQYVITSYKFNDLVGYKSNPDYQGVLGAPKTETVNVKYYADASNMKLDVQEGNIDVAFRSLSATDIDDLRGNDKVKVVEGPGGEIRYIVFNFNTQPYGAETPEADPAKALAVRQAVADLIDREEIASQVYKDTYTPLYSFVPDGLTGAIQPLKELYGDGEGGADVDKATKTLEDAGVEVPVELNLQYSNDHYGPSSGDEYALIKDQLEASGLFTVNLQTTEWVQYSKDRTADVYPAYQLGWFPDYSDADNYLSPFFLTENFLGNHYSNQEVNDLILEQSVEADADARTALIEEIQEKVAADLSTVPYLQGAQVAVVGSDVEGTEDTLDASFKFRYGAISKG
ncbi:peptide/nickel transport system substrate-binding protein [Agromyces flavus]|uniref:Peptide/nickel transport system substrate-binding protein n=1 Tax=Agromyces flavus TaxID=589382 RepID=A0A1H1S0X2_9MICO|nr:ABC transporter substrate-binding protein [Agromyces flavus]MCP2368914.1 peptide/nickel transport system substrate-binding protein [Agromyces flavus]GGI48371.1 peptide ABC transporter substrate-binding protein [Agromyces flavus]SDS40869.1 peptide/nickel transport system substrate-binding protein [Agromyces flavus]